METLENTGEVGTDWVGLLKQSREEESSGNDYIQILPLLPLVKDLLDRYNHKLECVSKEEKKKLILDVRAALRLALSWTCADDVSVRDQIRCDAVANLAWHRALFGLLTGKKVDSKCRILAAQLLSNLVTSHAEVAHTIASYLPLSPTEETVAARMRRRLSETPMDADPPLQLSWVDVLLSCAHNREALAGIVAVLHNSLASLQQQPENQWALRLAQNAPLVNTLLRQVISVRSVRPLDANERDQSLADAGTEWISLLLLRLCQLGWLPAMMSSIHATSASIVPEHVVLLQCLQSEVEMADHKDEPNMVLGSHQGLEVLWSSHRYLADLYGSLRRTVDIDNLGLLHGSNEPDDALNLAALVSVIDILAGTLGEDSRIASSVRSKFGKETVLVQDACQDLGALVDSAVARNTGNKNRDFVVLESEQRLLTSLVRLLGNLGFHCRENQDLVRLTPVPPRMEPPDFSSSHQGRNGLHVLLSCTRLSHACFTLREWAVIAIRNLLDDNEGNQAEVARLQANEPVQSTELASLGIRVGLDPKGNVSVIPTD